MNKRTIVMLTLLSSLLASCKADSSVNSETYPSVEESALEGVVRTNADSPDPTASQLERKKKNTETLATMGLPTLDSLPVVEDEETITPRTSIEVAQRCLAVVFCAVKGETQGEDQPLIDSLVKEYEAESFFSDKEAAFIKNRSPAEQELIDYAWRYECSHVFLWALGFIDQLKPPNEICDVPAEVRIIRDAGKSDFVTQAKLRTQAEILDMADLYYRLHWAAIELRINGKKSGQIDEGIIRERHRALNWLIRYMGQDWDNVTTDT